MEMVNSMRQVTVAEAKAQLSSLLDAVESGEPVLITRRGRAIAELVPCISPLPPVETLPSAASIPRSCAPPSSWGSTPP